MDCVKACYCCGQMRPYPTSPGFWEFAEIIDPDKELDWTKVEVKKDEVGLTITPIGESEPIWWPDRAQWRKSE